MYIETLLSGNNLLQYYFISILQTVRSSSKGQNLVSKFMILYYLIWHQKQKKLRIAKFYFVTKLIETVIGHLM